MASLSPAKFELFLPSNYFSAPNFCHIIIAIPMALLFPGSFGVFEISIYIFFAKLSSPPCLVLGFIGWVEYFSTFSTFAPHTKNIGDVLSSVGKRRILDGSSVVPIVLELQWPKVSVFRPLQKCALFLQKLKFSIKFIKIVKSYNQYFKHNKRWNGDTQVPTWGLR